MPALYPSFDIPAIVNNAVGESNRQKSSIYFDFALGDFACNSSGSIVTATPYEAWCQWCMKTVYTQRFAFMGYSDQVGIEAAEAFNEESRNATESTLIRTITEALLSDPYERTKRVYDFLFEWNVDGLSASFTVVGLWENDAILTARFKEGGISYVG